jgi:hypothetical protein
MPKEPRLTHHDHLAARLVTSSPLPPHSYVVAAFAEWNLGVTYTSVVRALAAVVTVYDRYTAVLGSSLPAPPASPLHSDLLRYGWQYAGQERRVDYLVVEPGDPPYLFGDYNQPGTCEYRLLLLESRDEAKIDRVATRLAARLEAGYKSRTRKKKEPP